MSYQNVVRSSAKSGLILFLFSFAIFAQTNCPDGQLKVEFMSPTTNKKKILCQVKKDGKYETMSELNAEATSATPVFAETGLKGLDSKVDIKNISENLKELLSIISTEEQVKTKNFRVNDCDKKRLEWLKIAMTQGKRVVNLQFAEFCDVNGKFEAQFAIPFNMNLQVRHLSNYKNTEMNVVLTVDLKKQGVELKFECLNGLLVSPTEKIKFRGWYSVNIDPLSGNSLPNTKSGEVTIIKVNDQDINKTIKIEYEGSSTLP